jgi:hypothetical protein
VAHLAKFDNLNSNDIMGDSFSTPSFGMPDSGFGPPKTLTMPSKMNNDFDEWGSNGPDVPF